MRGGRLSEPPTRAALDPPPRSSDSEPLPSCQNCYASNERVLAYLPCLDSRTAALVV